MKLQDWIRFSGDFMGPGAAQAPVARNKAVATKNVAADASPSDALDWSAKRLQEKVIGRNLRVFEWEGQHESHT